MLSGLLALIERYHPRVARAVRAVPRARFVPRDLRDYALDDDALPIGCGQTISQPSLVAYMTRHLELAAGERVLEIGTGSGYQAAVLAALGDVDVYTVEIIPELARQARERLYELGFINIHFKEGDGYAGWPEHAPYNAIVITAAAESVPPPLLAQLADGGRLVAPIGPAHGAQFLYKYTRRGAKTERQELLPVAFVPLTRAAPAP